MNFIPPLYTLFERLNSQGIHYCIIRDFESVEQVNTSSDIDVVVKKSDRSITRAILKELGWRTPSVNLSLYGHEQYYKWNGSGLIELDIVWDVFYSDGKYELSDQDDVYEELGKLTNANVLRIDAAIKLLVLHLLFDKNKVSEKNYIQLKRLYSIGNNKTGIIYDIARSIIEQRELKSDCALKWRQQIIKAGIINSRLSFCIKPKRKFKAIINSLKRRMHLGVFFFVKRNSVKVAIMGVDGAGKSSTIQKLHDYYKGSYVQYMGFREDSWESPLAKRWIYFGELKGFRKKISRFVKLHIAIIYDGYYRFWKAINSAASIVLFDRYYSERCIGSRGIGKFLFLFFLKILYPKPDMVFYLHCSIEESLRRKDDIEDVDEFIEMKDKWDSVYLTNSKVVSINTENVKENDVLGRIIEHIASY